ncbi:MAG: hypothetical protein L0Z63_04090 [Actinobacteria bacterium]|nr:hypothetical protein [Actinomycetota bacterium]
MVGAACSMIIGETPTDTLDSATTTSPGATSPPGGCVRVTSGTAPIDTGSVATDAISLAGEVFVCAADVVVVGEGNLNEVAAGAQLAAALGGPLLFPHPRLSAELGRLKPETIHVVGVVEVLSPPDVAVVRYDTVEALSAAAAALGTEATTPIPTSPDATTVVETVLAIESGDRVATPLTASGTTTQAVIDVPTLVRGLAHPTEDAAIWLVDADDPMTILFAAAAVHAVGAAVVAIDGDDLLGYPELGGILAGRKGVRFVGSVPEGGEWELAVLANGVELPGGGYHILPEDRQLRYVAFYGHPLTTALGALGEQGPGETLQRMEPFLEAYRGDGAETIPTFEIIVSVASAGPTDDGDYSYEWPIETFQPLVDAAAANGGYVVLDLQPGRDDFLTQAMMYTELLLLPHVGLALDPEWRLAPDQVHLEQVGEVDAAEVNTVINWLADLARDNSLPQKMLVLHSFRTFMIQNKELLVDRPEIQVVLQMDGDGTEAQKDNTWRQLREGFEDAFWAWGWKNFFDEDEPGPPSPESTMAKEPSPVYVSYQ